MRRLVSFGLIAALGGGCATFGTLQTARPIEKGSLQVGVESGMWDIEDAGAAPVANVTARYGAGKTWDVGARVGTAGIGFGGKIALTGAEPKNWAVALAPSFTTLPWGTRPTHLQIPVIVGYTLGPHELIVSPAIQTWSTRQTVDAVSTRSTAVFGGVSLGASVRITHGVRLVPQITFAQTVWGELDTGTAFSAVGLRPGRSLYQASFGILLGGEAYWWRRLYPGYGYGPPYPPAGAAPAR